MVPRNTPVVNTYLVRTCFATAARSPSRRAGCSARSACQLGKYYRPVILKSLFGLTLLELQSHFGDRPLKVQVVFPQNGTPVLTGLNHCCPEISYQVPGIFLCAWYVLVLNQSGPCILWTEWHKQWYYQSVPHASLSCIKICPK